MDNSDPIPDVSYRPPSIEESGIEILDLELFRSRLKHYHFDPYKPHRVKYYCFLYITEGQGEHLIDFERYPYDSGSVIFINPNQVHAFDASDRPQGKMINMTPAFFAKSAANIRTSYFIPTHLNRASSPVLQLSPQLNHSCHALLKEVSLAQQEGADDELVVQLLFIALLVKLGRQRKSHLAHLSEQQKERFGQFLNLVEQHYIEAREASQYAQWMHTSYKSLNQLCKSCCGQTAKQLIDFRTILEIKRKLVMDGLSTQETASDLSFEDSSYLNKYFKRLTGQTPAAFKRDNEF
ncbi:AraC family transcriptional regulator [Ferrimonas sp. YFM]|uniref:AraC family transcriptional regulator n=1 Tax=Ferrimonas sp. YFM TaxID=3028878 RepID=UPI0025740487|nr:AraC family transcriptional regulator [Ferrimonas sp. YFM]BDY03491.1 transcriptional regulator [Ferrimonas sp. YFM]